MTAAPAGTAGTIVAGHKPVPKAAALLAVLGVVYGDIGTSPLYAFKTSLQLFHGLPVTETEIMGILSLIFWSLILIVTVKYVLLVMRADNHGEGGILALMALAQRVSAGSSLRRILSLIGIAGATLLRVRDRIIGVSLGVLMPLLVFNSFGLSPLAVALVMAVLGFWWWQYAHSAG